MQTLNTWTLRVLLLLCGFVGSVALAASLYGVFWYDHQPALIIFAAVLLAMGLVSAYRNNVYRYRHHPQFQKWEDVYLIAVGLVVLISAVILESSPLRQLAYLISCVTTFAFTTEAVFDNFWSFWHQPSWTNLRQRLI